MMSMGRLMPMPNISLLPRPVSSLSTPRFPGKGPSTKFLGPFTPSPQAVPPTFIPPWATFTSTASPPICSGVSSKATHPEGGDSLWPKRKKPFWTWPIWDSFPALPWAFSIPALKSGISISLKSGDMSPASTIGPSTNKA